ncbi:MAG: F0F1 ATP synthase subunit B [Pseudomonadota bacterium]|jgi:F-type H+-transporting ATPase subunit b|nr:MAG: F0F1 ATP synthase subunit B [Pseudomonadota bacterium]
MELNLTFFGQILVFLILLWFIGKFVTPFFAAAIDERQKKIAEGLSAADRGQKSLDEARARADEVIGEARDRANQIIDGASRRANEIVEAAKQSAQAEADRLIAAARQQIELDAARAREELRRQVAELTVRSAAKVLGREIDASKHADILGKLAAEI